MRAFSRYGRFGLSVLPLIVLLFIGCGNSVDKRLEEVDIEVSDLLDNDKKQAFLEGILIELQDLQLEEESFRLHISEKNNSRREFEERKAKIQAEHYMMISSYFEHYGYPSRAALGQYAAYAPFVVLYYSEDDSQFREDQFKYFYGAYRFNDLPENMFYSYLLNYFKVHKSSEYKEDVASSVEDNIYNMMDELGMEY